MKNQAGSVRNFREYKRNESSFPHSARVSIDEGIAISRSFQYSAMQLWQNLQTKKLQRHSSHIDTCITAITGSALVARVRLTPDSAQMPAEESGLDCGCSDDGKLGIC